MSLRGEVPQPVPNEEISNREKISIPGTKRELDDQTKQRLRDWSLQWLESFYTNPGEGEIDTARFLPDVIAQVSGTSRTDEEGYYQPRYRQAAEFFLNTLIDFVQNKSSDPNAKQRLKAFTRNIYEALFSWTPNILSDANPETQLILTARANRVPEVQGYFGQSMTGELAYNLAWGGQSMAPGIIKRTQELSLAEQLDVVEQLQTVAAVGLAEQPEGVGINAVNVSRKIINILREQIASPLFAYKTNLVLERLGQEEDDPSLGVLSWHGDRGKSKSRLGNAPSQQMRQEHSKLAGQINPDIAIEGTMTPIASDAVAVFDHSQLPRQVARVDLERLGKPEEISIVALRNAIETCKDPRRLYPEDLVDLISFIDEKIVAYDNKSWVDVSDRLTKEDWEEFFKAKQNFENLRQRYNQALYSGQLESYNDRQLWQSDEGQGLIEAATKVASAYPIIRPKLVAYLEGVESRLTKKLTPAHFESYQQITTNRELNPFASSEDQNLSLLLQHLHQPELRQKIEEDLGINLTEIPLRSQIHLLRFLAGQDQEGFDRLRSILKSKPELGNKILNAFLAVSEDMKLGEVILGMAEKMDQASLSLIFDKYLEIAKTSEEVREFLQKHYSGDLHDDSLTFTVQKNILLRANQLLKRSFESIEQGNSVSVLERIKLEQGNASLLAATIRATVESGGSSESIKGLTSSEAVGPELSAEEADTMEKMYGQNWIYKTTPEYWQQLLNKFKDSIKNPKARFRILRDNGKIIAFLRFMDTQDDDGQSYIHFGAFNVDPAYQNGKIGEDFLAPAIKLEQEKGLAIRCETNPNNPMLRKYEAMGFQRIGTAAEFGEPEVKLEIPASQAKEIRAA